MKTGPVDFKLESTSIWSFEERGSWATHNSNYRGNWSPYVPRDLILKYSKPDEWVLDQFVGGGTTLIEAKLLNRNSIGIDINPETIEIAKKNMSFNCKNRARWFAKVGDAANLILKDESIDLICTHPPYSNAIRYSSDIEEDISLLEVDSFLQKISQVAIEAYRVLKKEKICAVMMGDIRRKGNVIPLGFHVMKEFSKQGFLLRDIIIKKQFNCQKTTYWKRKNVDFFLLQHEYIFIFCKVQKR